MEIATPTRNMMWALAVAGAIALAPLDAAAQTNGSSGGFFSGLFGHSSTPASPPSDPAQNSADPLRIDNNKKKPGVELYVAVAHLYIVTGKLAEAEDQFREAQKIDKDDIRVLLGYAMLKDQMNQPEEAIKLYLQAEKKYPKNPAVYNNLAVHLIRYNMVPQAIEAARHAVDLRPMEPRYRNNLAALLVEAGQFQEAFRQLRAIYDEPVAHYDLGFLLNKRGLKPAALQEFSIALQLSPGMVLARQWVEKLSRERAEHEATALSTAPLGPPPAMVAPPPMYQREMGPPAMIAPQPPQYAAPQQFGAPQYRVAGLPPAPVPEPGPAPAVAPQYQSPQYQAPQYQAPQYQLPGQAAPNGVPLTAARDSAMPLVAPAMSDAGNLHRLPPVSDPPRGAQDSDQVAPDPPDLRR